MKFILVFALLPAGASAPSMFQVQGYDAADKCSAAKAALMREHTPFGKRVILWSACLPTNDADGHEHH